MLSFAELAASEDNDQDSLSNNLSVAPPLEIKQRVLQRKLARLKREVNWYQQQVDSLNRDTSMSPPNDALVKALLMSNNTAVRQVLTEEAQERENRKLEDDAERYDVFYPVRSGETASLLMQLFHSLVLASSTKIQSNEIHETLIKGHCNAPHGANFTLFRFSVVLHIYAKTHSVEDLTVKLNPWVKREIGHYMALQQTRKDVYRVMHGLAQYSNVCIKRFAVFQALKLKYKCDDSLWKHSPRMVFVLNADTNFNIVLSWKISISPSSDEACSRVYVQLNRPLSSLNANAPDLSNWSEVFSTLVKEHGVYRAFCIVYDLLTAGDSVQASRESSVAGV